MTLIVSQEGKLTCHTLRPLTDAKWAKIRHEVQRVAPELPAETIVPSEANSIADVTQTLNAEGGTIVDASREVRVKLYMGQVCQYICSVF
jgi:phosphatidylinositol-3,4,5-trisphosphate 3-phosphatase/dual-specificity protein phosphatase PTEN